MTRSAQELRQESERARAELASTIGRLRERISETAEDIRQRASPEHIRSEVSDLISYKARSWVQALKRQASENPTYAVAAGAVMAVPLLRLARGLPLPLFMIGTGIALTSKTGGSRAAGAATSALDGAGDRLGEASERARALNSDVKDRLFSIQSQAAGFGNHAAETVQSGASQITSTIRDTISASTDAAKNAAASAHARARQVVGGNALLIGALGITAGAILAAALPNTKAEAKAMGPASDHLKQAAGEAAQSGFEKATDATISAFDAAAAKVAEADLGDNASRMTQNMKDTLKGAVDDLERASLGTSRNPNT